MRALFTRDVIFSDCMCFPIHVDVVLGLEKYSFSRPELRIQNIYVQKSMECDIFPSVLLTLLAGPQEGYPACKKTGCWFVGGDDLTGALHDL